jgi:phage shock protein PspC (stress-responsive transcriptional regulator)
MARRDQRLYLDTDDKMIGGVCGGLGRYFDIDTTLVRIAFVVFTLVGGSGPLAYLILWAILDPAPHHELPPPPETEPFLEQGSALPVVDDRPLPVEEVVEETTPTER